MTTARMLEIAASFLRIYDQGSYQKIPKSGPTEETFQQVKAHILEKDVALWRLVTGNVTKLARHANISIDESKEFMRRVIIEITNEKLANALTQRE